MLGNSLTAERLAEDRGPALQHGVMLGADILRGHPLGAIYNATRLLSNRMRGSSPEVDSDIARPLTTPLSAGSPGMDLLRNAATMLPNVRRLYLGRFAAGGAGLAVGGNAMRWRRVVARTWLVLSVVWVAWIVLIFSYGEPAPVQELLTALVPPALGLFAVSAVAWVAER